MMTLSTLRCAATDHRGLATQAPGFATTCNSCGLEIDVGTGMRCTVCADYDLCNACGNGLPGQNHPHRLVVRAGSPVALRLASTFL